MDYPIRTADQLEPLLKAFRKTKGLSQTDLARRIGITQQTFQELEAAPARVSVERLLTILATLNVEVVLRERPTEKPPTAEEW